MLLGLIIWAVMGLLFAGLGVSTFPSEEEAPFDFWANTDVLPVEDVEGYDRTISKLRYAYGAVFILLGTPLLGGQNSTLILLSVVGMMTEVIAAMAIYVTVMEKKYRKR